MHRFPVRMRWGGGPIRRPALHSRFVRKKGGRAQSPYADYPEKYDDFASHDVNKDFQNSNRNSPQSRANKHRQGNRDLHVGEKRSGSISRRQNAGPKHTKRGSDSKSQRRNSDSGSRERRDEVEQKGKNIGSRCKDDGSARSIKGFPRKKAGNIFKHKNEDMDNVSTSKTVKTRKRSPDDLEIIEPLSLGQKSRMRTITHLPPIEKGPGICSGKAIGQAVLANHPNEGKEFLSLKVFDVLKSFKHCLCIIETYVPGYCDGCSICKLQGITEDQLQPSGRFCKCGGQLWRTDMKDMNYFICSTCALNRIYRDEHSFRHFLDYSGFVLPRDEESQLGLTETSEVTQDAKNPASLEENLVEKMANLSTKEQSWAKEVDITKEEEFCPSEASGSGEEQDEEADDAPEPPKQCLGKTIAEKLTRVKGKRNMEFSFLPFHYYSAFIERCTCILRGITHSFCDKCYVCSSEESPQPILVYCSCGGQLCEVDTLRYTVCSRCALHRGKERLLDFSYFSQKRYKSQ